MQTALRQAYRGVRKDEGGPFGACLVHRGKILASSHNRVLKTHDATAHAEMNVLRRACRLLKRWDLSGCTMVTTTEPCPMCFSAIHWARIPVVVYGTSIKDVQHLGFNEIPLSAVQINRRSGGNVRLIGGVMLQECRQLLEYWEGLSRKVY